MDKNRLHRECMGIVNQLFDLAEVAVDKRHAINDTADKYLQEQFLRLFVVVGQSEQLKAVEKLKDFAYEVCPLHREDDLEEIVGSL